MNYPRITSLFFLTSIISPTAFSGEASDTLEFQRETPMYSARIDCPARSVKYIKADIPPVNTADQPYTVNPVVLDGQLPSSCQQKSTAPYPLEAAEASILMKRGELISSEYFRHSTMQNLPRYAYNTIPRVRQPLNSDAWAQIDKRLACLRSESYPSDIDSLTIIAGVIWNDSGLYGSIGSEPYLDEFGIKAPKALWKIAIMKRGSLTDLNAWIIPNTRPIDADDLNDYLVPPSAIADEIGSGEILDLIPSGLQKYNPNYGFALRQNCK